jgi:hypothetical protein
MRNRITRHVVRFLAVAGVVVASLAIDPDPRGPLAIAADLWLSGHDAAATRWFERAVPALETAGIDPRNIRLSLDLDATATEDESTTLATQLDRLARDDRAKTLYTALYLARRGDRIAARERLATLLGPAAPARVLELHHQLAEDP